MLCDKKKFPYWIPTNIWRQSTEFLGPENLASGTFTPLYLGFQLFSFE